MLVTPFSSEIALKEADPDRPEANKQAPATRGSGERDGGVGRARSSLARHVATYDASIGSHKVTF